MSHSQYDVWTKRYAEEGAIWGGEPSLTARRLLEEFDRAGSGQRKIFEIGMGYGRDTFPLVKAGHAVHASEAAIPSVDVLVALRKLSPAFVFSTQLPWEWSSYNHQSFDAITSHRTLHLIDRSVVRGYRARFAEMLKDNGLLILSARDPRDFNPDQMTMVKPGTAVYNDRPGHVITFWSEQKFRSNFSKDFEIVNFEQGTEIESTKNPVNSHFTIMMARRKPRTAALDA